MTTTIAIVGVTLTFPFTPPGDSFGFKPLPVSFLIAMAAIVALYIVSGDVVKGVFYKRVKF